MPELALTDQSQSILIVSANREDRRVLFNALDRHGLAAVLSASDVGQARQTLAEEHNIRVVFLDLSLATGEFINTWRELENGREISIIGIVPAADNDAARWGWDKLPQNTVECVQSPVHPGEIIYRLAKVFEGAKLARPEQGPRSQEPLFESIQDGLLYLDSSSFEIQDANEAFLSRTGFTKSDLAGRSFFDLDLSHDETQKKELTESLNRDGRLHYRCRIKLDNDRWYPAEVNLQLGLHEDYTRYLAIVRDLTVQQQTERALNLIVTSFDTHLGDRDVNRLVAQTVTWLGADYLLIGTQGLEHHNLEVHALYCHSTIRNNLEDNISSGLLRRVLNGEEITLRAHAWRDGSDPFVVENSIESYIGIPLIESNKEVSGALIFASRQRVSQWELVVTTLKILANRFAMELQTKRFFEDTRSQGLSDTLTKLPNRLLFEDRLDSALKEAQRTGELFAVMFVDLDRFKAVNDSFGHAVGDQLLRGVARRLSTSIRASDTVARYAGDEFTIVLRHIIQREDVFRIAQKLNKALAEPLQLPEGKEIACTASIGVSFYPDDGDSGAELVKHADQAMYNAKGLGRNTYQSYVNIPEESQQQRMLLEAKLRNAQKNNELRVYYQPQLDTESEDIIGMEALIRWQHPELGLISPGFFIPLAEESGLIIPMGNWVLGRACAQVAQWNERFGLQLRVGVNLSALQLRQPDIIDTVDRALRESGLPSHLLDLEVTESLSLKEVPNLLNVLEQLKKRGCSIAIDDFGTGHSSLEHIKRFPADRVKVDQTFVRNIGVDPDDAAIVEATIAMAHNLKRVVVAEGVEEEQQLEYLKKQHCEEVQGYLFCRPLPTQAFERLLTDRQRLLGEQAAAAS